mmetsp:Transcript_8364/g.27398  ORF Transcript_8364/g.27398 Transcript_8364/m.27398 type:complete len:236 (+) Transcript_8364:38-745(+)
MLAARFFGRYEAALASNPVPTKMVTGGLLWGLGDAVAQAGTAEPMDAARLGRAVVYGTAIHAPVAHVHYEFLEAFVQRFRVSAGAAPIVKLVMEQFVYWGWLSNALYHFSMATMEGYGVTDSVQRVNDRLWPTMKSQYVSFPSFFGICVGLRRIPSRPSFVKERESLTSFLPRWAFWIPVQYLNFKFVPVRHQLGVVLATSVAWCSFLSLTFNAKEETTTTTTQKDATDAPGKQK